MSAQDFTAIHPIISDIFFCLNQDAGATQPWHPHGLIRNTTTTAGKRLFLQTGRLSHKQKQVINFSEILCKIYFGPKADLQKYNMCNHGVHEASYRVFCIYAALPACWKVLSRHCVKANCKSYCKCSVIVNNVLHSTLVITKSQVITTHRQ